MTTATDGKMISWSLNGKKLVPISGYRYSLIISSHQLLLKNIPKQVNRAKGGRDANVGGRFLGLIEVTSLSFIKESLDECIVGKLFYNTTIGSESGYMFKCSLTRPTLIQALKERQGDKRIQYANPIVSAYESFSGPINGIW